MLIQKADEDRKQLQKEIDSFKKEAQLYKEKISLLESLNSERQQNKTLDTTSKSRRKDVSETKSPSRIESITDRKQSIFDLEAVS